MTAAEERRKNMRQMLLEKVRSHNIRVVERSQNASPAKDGAKEQLSLKLAAAEERRLTQQKEIIDKV